MKRDKGDKMNKKEMLESVRVYLSQLGRVDEQVLKAIEKIDRKSFMYENKELAYVDNAVPIGHGQTISQPSTVACMLSLLELKKGDNVLEIGTGSGWNASLIGFLVNPGKVLSLEVVKELAESAREKIKKQGLKNIIVEEKDFRKLKTCFDKIIFTAGISQGKEKIIEEFAQKHLNENGILICPFQSGPLIILKKKDGKIKKDYTKEEYVFVPLVL